MNANTKVELKKLLDAHVHQLTTMNDAYHATVALFDNRTLRCATASILHEVLKINALSGDGTDVGEAASAMVAAHAARIVALADLDVWAKDLTVGQALLMFEVKLHHSLNDHSRLNVPHDTLAAMDSMPDDQRRRSRGLALLAITTSDANVVNRAFDQLLNLKVNA